MAVAVTLQLPNQPSTGAVHRTPLGGDGFRAPMASYIVDNFQISGNVSGGSLLGTVNMDERFCALVAYITTSITQTTPADTDLRLRLDTSGANSPVAAQVQSIAAANISATVSTATINEIWTPTPTILPGSGAGALFSVQGLNNDGDLFRISALIYLFNINVRQVMPMGPLLWARGST